MLEVVIMPLEMEGELTDQTLKQVWLFQAPSDTIQTTDVWSANEEGRMSGNIVSEPRHLHGRLV